MRPEADRLAPVSGARTLLVANRGEIAVRIFATCRRLGIRTVAVAGPGDEGALPHAGRRRGRRGRVVPRRRRARRRGARERGATLVHPGYGFLAESADFAEAVRRRGPDLGRPAARRRFAGEATSSRRSGSPPPPASRRCRPATRRSSASRCSSRPRRAAAAAGCVSSSARRSSTRRSRRPRARREAAFGDGTVYCERYLRRPRHVEVQLIGDRHGTVLALGERDCSVQRRHQKVVEESPAARACRRAPPSASRSTPSRSRGELGYESAGTAEFLVDGDDVFFLELNGRIQVEHPVTEAVTGLDLVELQLRVADGESLADLRAATRGHAVEARLYAEDPRSFLPQPGTVAASPAADEHPRRRGRRGRRRGRCELRPDDRQADRARRRPRRGARPARAPRSRRPSSRA